MSTSNPPATAGAELKLQHAERHLASLRRGVQDFCDSDPFEIVIVTDPDGRRRVYRASVDRRVPPELSLVFGDFVHNLRSALDYAINDFRIQLSGGTTTTTGFPIFDREDGPRGYRTKAPGMLGPLPDRALVLVDAVQPFHGTGRPTPTNLSVLQALWNKDKHRAILLSAAVVRPYLFGHDRLGGRDPGIEARVSASRQSAEWAVNLDPERPDEQFDVRFAVEVVLAEDGPLSGQPIVNVGGVMYGVVRDLLRDLDSAFEGSSPLI